MPERKMGTKAERLLSRSSSGDERVSERRSSADDPELAAEPADTGRKAKSGRKPASLRQPSRGSSASDERGGPDSPSAAGDRDTAQRSRMLPLDIEGSERDPEKGEGPAEKPSRTARARLSAVASTAVSAAKDATSTVVGKLSPPTPPTSPTSQTGSEEPKPCCQRKRCWGGGVVLIGVSLAIWFYVIAPMLRASDDENGDPKPPLNQGNNPQAIDGLMQPGLNQQAKDDQKSSVQQDDQKSSVQQVDQTPIEQNDQKPSVQQDDQTPIEQVDPSANQQVGGSDAEQAMSSDQSANQQVAGSDEQEIPLETCEREVGEIGALDALGAQRAYSGFEECCKRNDIDKASAEATRNKLLDHFKAEVQNELDGYLGSFATGLSGRDASLTADRSWIEKPMGTYEAGGRGFYIPADAVKKCWAVVVNELAKHMKCGDETSGRCDRAAIEELLHGEGRLRTMDEALDALKKLPLQDPRVLLDNEAKPRVFFDLTVPDEMGTFEDHYVKKEKPVQWKIMYRIGKKDDQALGRSPLPKELELYPEGEKKLQRCLFLEDLFLEDVESGTDEEYKIEYKLCVHYTEKDSNQEAVLWEDMSPFRDWSWDVTKKWFVEKGFQEHGNRLLEISRLKPGKEMLTVKFKVSEPPSEGQN